MTNPCCSKAIYTSASGVQTAEFGSFLRLAYDILSPKDDDKASVFFRAKAAAGAPASSDEAKVITFEYKYKLAKNTRVRIGYTDFKYDSGNAFSDYNMFWTELYVKY